MDLELVGRRALVTGGSRGIGRAVAAALAIEGATVAICARTHEPLEVAARELTTETGGEVRAFVADTTDPEAVGSMVEAVEDAFGGVDILVNAAARAAGGAPEDLIRVTEETIRGDVEEKVLGYLRVSRAVLPSMRSGGWGRIVHIGGLMSRTAGNVSAGIRNVALVHLTKTMSVALGADGITVNLVHPALTLTERVRERLRVQAEEEGVTFDEVAVRAAAATAIGRIVHPEEVADVVAFLCSPRAMTITGESIAVGGGVGNAVYL